MIELLSKLLIHLLARILLYILPPLIFPYSQVLKLQLIPQSKYSLPLCLMGFQSLSTTSPLSLLLNLLPQRLNYFAYCL